MRHHDNKRKFHREKNVRTALMKSLALSLVQKGRIKTTDAKARELRPFVEKMITIGKKADLSSQRNLISKIGLIGAIKLVKEISPKYLSRTSGYTRITKLPARLSDGGLMAVIELI